MTTAIEKTSAIAALQRYNSAVATIQIREIPEDAYETLRRLARAEGKSLQSYMRDRMIELANQSARSASFAALEEVLAKHPPRGGGAKSILADLDAGRHERFGD